MTEQKTKNEQKKEGFFTPAVVDTIAAVSSVAAGAVTATQMIERDFHHNFSTLHLTKDLKEPRNKWGESHVNKLESRLINTEESAHLIKAQSRTYQHELSVRKTEAGFGTLRARASLIHPHQWGAIIVTSLAVTGVGIGSFLLLTKNLFSGKEPEKSFAKAEEIKAETAQNNHSR